MTLFSIRSRKTGLTFYGPTSIRMAKPNLSRQTSLIAIAMNNMTIIKKTFNEDSINQYRKMQEQGYHSAMLQEFYIYLLKI
jgi:hypothetical protein